MEDNEGAPPPTTCRSPEERLVEKMRRDRKKSRGEEVKVEINCNEEASASLLSEKSPSARLAKKMRRDGNRVEDVSIHDRVRDDDVPPDAAEEKKSAGTSRTQMGDMWEQEGAVTRGTHGKKVVSPLDVQRRPGAIAVEGPNISAPEEPMHVAEREGTRLPPTEFEIVTTATLVPPDSALEESVSDEKQEVVVIAEKTSEIYLSKRARFGVAAIVIVLVSVILGTLLGIRPWEQDPVDLNEKIRTSLMKQISVMSPDNGRALNASGSPQSRAFEWLIGDTHLLNYSDVRKLERYALATFFESTNGTQWLASDNWMEYDASECDWYRVKCNAEKQVSELALNGNGLEGSLVSELVMLESLTGLILNDNSLDGSTIPSVLGELESLEVLALSRTNISGTIPVQLGKLSLLRHLLLQENNLSGSIPTEIGQVPDETQASFDITPPHLEILNLGENRLQETIPPELGHLTSLKYLGLYSNLLSGVVPEELGDMMVLNHIDLKQNDLTGSMPSKICRRFVREDLSQFETECEKRKATLEDVSCDEEGLLEVCQYLKEATDICATESLLELQADCLEVDCLCCTVCWVDGVDACENTVGGRCIPCEDEILETRTCQCQLEAEISCNEEFMYEIKNPDGYWIPVTITTIERSGENILEELIPDVKARILGGENHTMSLCNNSSAGACDKKYCNIGIRIEASMRGEDCKNKDCKEGGCCCSLSVYNTEACDIDSHSDIGSNGRCDGRYNTKACAWDFGDCEEENKQLWELYPECIVPEPSLIGDGYCDGEYNTKECNFDGGDCTENNKQIADLFPNCFVSDSSRIGDGECDEGEFNTEECGWDGSDCVEFNQNYPDCKVEDPSALGDGYCDEKEFNTEECGWDGGDCIEANQKLSEKFPGCFVRSPSNIGDGNCDASPYNSEICGWDGDDCLVFNRLRQMYPDCFVARPDRIEDGKCDGGVYNTIECGWDGSDCDEFNSNYPRCIVNTPSKVGDGECDSGVYNTEECDWDGQDCTDFNSKYPDCLAGRPSRVGDGKCDGREYNNELCGMDGGDCVEFNANQSCDAENPSLIENGECNGQYNTAACNFDGGDCKEFNEQYPNCYVNNPSWIGDDICDGGSYNSKACGWDGGDCLN